MLEAQVSSFPSLYNCGASTKCFHKLIEYRNHGKHITKKKKNNDKQTNKTREEIRHTLISLCFRLPCLLFETDCQWNRLCCAYTSRIIRLFAWIFIIICFTDCFFNSGIFLINNCTAGKSQSVHVLSIPLAFTILTFRVSTVRKQTTKKELL